MKEKYQTLFEPMTLKNGTVLKNRIVMAPMTTWSSNDDATVSDEEVDYYQQRVQGVGLVITGCTHVTANGIGFSDEFAAYDDSFLPSLEKLAKATKSGGAQSILQIFHAGNKTLSEFVPGGEIVAPSSVPTESRAFDNGAVKTPRPLEHKEILDIIHAFGEATKRAIIAGFDGVEIHGAHGFLIQNFVSSYYNQRTDEWGGSLENRLRFPISVVQEIQKVIDEYADRPFVLGYRLSPDEPQEGGLQMDDTYALIESLIEQGFVDYIHASLPDALSSKPFKDVNDKTYLELIAERVNQQIPLLAAGSLQTPDDVLKALESGLSLAVIGRPLVINPDWVKLVQNNSEDQIQDTLSLSKADDLAIPKKLRTVIQSTPNWIKTAE
ncbi:NADH-dependent flavin oxidoreductase [Paenibacillus polymyxa]|uniref:NADH-dependent flavin oxidoreductase n=1 Tax=Paenibacillus polymyxa TaxID=1406 RepID=UPI0023498AB3|nr:NADH-dependent flavin oxidoreductase [Paenibacillus polymyxa]WCM60727.1 NADH-dependent flavin oxidoreductase [Paenibacillus polymyxa]